MRVRWVRAGRTRILNHRRIAPRIPRRDLLAHAVVSLIAGRSLAPRCGRLPQFGCGKFAEFNCGRAQYFGVTQGLDVNDCLLMFPAATSCTTIERYQECKLSHLGVMGSADNTTVGGNAAEDEDLCAKAPE